MYLGIFIILAILALLFQNRNPNKYVKTTVFLILFFIVGFRGSDVDNDYLSYLDAIRYPESSLIAEYSFKVISSIFYNFFDSTLLTFLFYAFLGVRLKFIAINRYSNYFWLSMLIYFSTFFILQEMNAMRAGVACGFMLLSLKPWKERKYLETGIYLLIAFIFHTTFVIMFPIALIVSATDKNILKYFLLIPLGYLVYYLVDLSTIAAVLNLDYVSSKINAYSDIENQTNVWSTVFLIKILFVILLYVYKKKLNLFSEYFYIYLKLYCIGIFILLSFAKFPAASMRFLDLFIIVELFLLPLFCDLFIKKFRWIPTLLLIGYSYFYLYLYIDLAHYIREYYTIFD